MLKKIIFALFVLISIEANPFSFGFKIFNANRGLKDYGSYKGWDDGSYAKSCNDYRNNSKTNLRYTGSTGDGFYKINPDNGVPFIAYCDMTTVPTEGWTLIIAGGMTASYINTPAALYNGTSTESYNFTILNTVTISHSQLISVISRVPFKDIKIAGYILSSTNANSTFAQKYTSLTGWTSTMCSVSASSTTINLTEYGWNLDHSGYFTRTASTLGCLVGAGTPDNNMAHIDYAYIGLGVYTTSNPACTPQGGYYAACGNRYLVGFTGHRQSQSYDSTAAMATKGNLVWIK